MLRACPTPAMVTADPPTPPQPFCASAASVGAYSRLLTLPDAFEAMVGVDPLVRIRPN